MKASKKTIKLNLGCGMDHRNGYINIDAVSAVNPDLVHDISKTLPYKDGTVQEVIAQDILEHFIFDDFIFVISEIARVLKDGGTLHVRTPNVDAILHQFEDDKEVRNIFLYGSTAHRTDTGVFGAHKIGFTRTRLIAELLVYGLEVTSIGTNETNFEASFVKSTPLKAESILFLNQALSIGGAEVFDTDLFSSLKQQGVRVAAYTNNTIFAHMLHFSEISTLSVPWVVDFIGNVKGLIKALVYGPLLFFWYGKTVYAHRSVDVMVVSGFTEKILASFWAYVFDIPMVWIEFGPLTTLLNKCMQLPKLLYRLVADLPERVIVPSQNTAADLLRSARISLAKIEYIPCGTSQQSSKKFSDVAQPVIVCPSRLEKGKGQDILLEAFAQVLKDIPKAHLQIIGVGDFITELEALVTKLGIQKSVSFLGRVRDVDEYLQKAQLVVFPSVWELEGFGLVTIEAMALAKPVVAFNRGPTNEIVVDGETGVLAEPGDSGALAEAIVKVMHSSKLRMKLGTGGLKRFNDLYRIDLVAEQYQLAFRRAIAWHRAGKK